MRIRKAQASPLDVFPCIAHGFASVCRALFVGLECAGKLLLVRKMGDHSHSILEVLAKAAAQLQSDLGVKHDLVLTPAMQLESADLVAIHDDRAVDANEGSFVQLFFESLKAPAQDMRNAADMQASVVIRRFLRRAG